MFTLIEEYDVQATRREAREEGMLKGKFEGKLEGRIEGKIEGRIEGEIEGELKGKLEAAINIIKEINLPLSRAMSIVNLQEANRSRLVEELTRMNIAYTE
jgi:predicted transposase YdaD